MSDAPKKVITPAASRTEAGVMGLRALVKQQENQIEILQKSVSDLETDIADAKAILDALFPEDTGGSMGGVSS